MRWEISGADKETGADVAVEIEAPTAKDATLQANRRGILIERLRPGGKPPPPPAHTPPRPPPLPAFEPAAPGAPAAINPAPVLPYSAPFATPARPRPPSAWRSPATWVALTIGVGLIGLATAVAVAVLRSPTRGGGVGAPPIPALPAVAAKSTLGLSYARVTQNLGQHLVLVPEAGGTAMDGTPRHVGQRPGGDVMMLVTGQPADVDYAHLVVRLERDMRRFVLGQLDTEDAFMFPEARGRRAREHHAALRIFVDNVAPSWASRRTWLDQELRRLPKGGQTEMVVGTRRYVLEVSEFDFVKLAAMPAW